MPLFRNPRRDGHCCKSIIPAALPGAAKQVDVRIGDRVIALRAPRAEADAPVRKIPLTTAQQTGHDMVVEDQAQIWTRKTFRCART